MYIGVGSRVARVARDTLSFGLGHPTGLQDCNYLYKYRRLVYTLLLVLLLHAIMSQRQLPSKGLRFTECTYNTHS